MLCDPGLKKSIGCSVYGALCRKRNDNEDLSNNDTASMRTFDVEEKPSIA